MLKYFLSYHQIEGHFMDDAVFLDFWHWLAVSVLLQVVAPENMPPVEPDEDQWFRDEVNSRIQ